MKKYIRVCQICGNTFETDSEIMQICNPCDEDLIQAGEWVMELDKMPACRICGGETMIQYHLQFNDTGFGYNEIFITCTKCGFRIDCTPLSVITSTVKGYDL